MDIAAVDDHEPEPDYQHHRQFKVSLAVYVLQWTQTRLYFTLKHVQIRLENIYFFTLLPLLPEPLIRRPQTLLNHLPAPPLLPHSPAAPGHSQIPVDIPLITSQQVLELVVGRLIPALVL